MVKDLSTLGLDVVEVAYCLTLAPSGLGVWVLLLPVPAGSPLTVQRPMCGFQIACTMWLGVFFRPVMAVVIGTLSTITRLFSLLHMCHFSAYGNELLLSHVLQRPAKLSNKPWEGKVLTDVTLGIKILLACLSPGQYKNRKRSRCFSPWRFSYTHTSVDNYDGSTLSEVWIKVPIRVFFPAY